jgi:hypothetical protein
MCFSSLQSEIRRVAAVGTGGIAPNLVPYNISSAYFNLANALSRVATQKAGFAFYAGVAIGCISGTLRCIAYLCDIAGALDENTIAAIGRPAEDAWMRLAEYADILDVDLKSTLGHAPSAKGVQSVGLGQFQSTVETCDELLSRSLALSRG